MTILTVFLPFPYLLRETESSHNRIVMEQDRKVPTKTPPPAVASLPFS